MICTSLPGPRVRDCLAQLAGLEMAEIRMDLIKDLDEEGVRKIFALPAKLVATCRPKGGNGEKEAADETAGRERMLLLAVSAGAAYVDVELESPSGMRKRIGEAAKQKGCSVILSHHDFEKTPSAGELEKIKKQCFAQGADIAKLACMAQDKESVERMLQLCDQRTIAIAMGPHGSEARAKIVALGSPFTFAALDEKSATAPGQVSRQKMAQMMKKNENFTLLFAVAGNPVSHSMSPAAHNAGFEALGLPATYFRLLAEDAQEVLDTARAMGLKGLSITSPFKEQMARCVDRMDESAAKMGAVNTVVFEDGKAIGYNVDGVGVTGSLKHAGVQIRGRNAVVIGAGGAAKAAVAGLMAEGAQVVCANRTLEKAGGIAKTFGCSCASLEKEQLTGLIRHAHILVSCTSTGERIVPPQALHKELAVLEAYYHTESALVRDARAAGCKLVSPLDWLLYQGLGAFSLFSGKQAPEEEMRKGLEKARQAQAKPIRKIALIGMMGAGKSAVGKKLAACMGRRFVDMDGEIEKKAGKKISDIFAQEGEEKFRRMESARLAELAEEQEALVVSCGGGVVLREENRQRLRKHFAAVWLFAPVPVLAGRTAKNRNRPLLKGGGREERLHALLDERMAHYANSCEFALNTDQKTVAQVAGMVEHEIRHAQ